MTDELRRSFGPAALRALAWGRSYERGQGYVVDGRVKRLKVGDAEVGGDVRGTETYRVRLWLEGGAPRFSCTCPVAADGLFCKHCVAVSLAAFDADVGATGSGTPPANDGLRAYLENVDKSRLVDLLLERAADDDLLKARLELGAVAAQAAETADGAASEAGRAGGRVVGYRRVIRDVIRPRGFVDHRSMYEYARGIDELIDALRDLLADGLAAELVLLCEHALTCLEDALGSVDDSSGHMGDIRDRLVALHHEACLQSRPDPVALADRLFEWELHSEWEIFLGAAAVYEDVLGEAGVAAYRRRAEEVWERTPASGPVDERDHSSRRFRITYVMETLAELDGDVDGLIAVKERDLSSPYRFVQIAEICAAAGRHDDALCWAERGMAAYPDCGDVRLVDVLATEYERSGRVQDAVLLMWSLVERRPTVGSFQRLKTYAARAGLWGSYRDQAFERLREGPDVYGAGPARPAGRSEVVEALLWEGDVDAAWAEAVAGGCSASLWMTLAAARAVDHPEDALPVYERHVERSIAEKTARGYDDAVSGLRAIEALLARLGRSEEFPAQVAAIRTMHRQKRSLLKQLDAAGW